MFRRICTALGLINPNIEQKPQAHRQTSAVTEVTIADLKRASLQAGAAPQEERIIKVRAPTIAELGRITSSPPAKKGENAVEEPDSTPVAHQIQHREVVSLPANPVVAVKDLTIEPSIPSNEDLIRTIVAFYDNSDSYKTFCDKFKIYTASRENILFRGRLNAILRIDMSLVLLLYPEHIIAIRIAKKTAVFYLAIDASNINTTSRLSIYELYLMSEGIQSPRPSDMFPKDTATNHLTAILNSGRKNVNSLFMHRVNFFLKTASFLSKHNIIFYTDTGISLSDRALTRGGVPMVLFDIDGAEKTLTETNRQLCVTFRKFICLSLEYNRRATLSAVARVLGGFKIETTEQANEILRRLLAASDGDTVIASSPLQLTAPIQTAIEPDPQLNLIEDDPDDDLNNHEVVERRFRRLKTCSNGLHELQQPLSTIYGLLLKLPRIMRAQSPSPGRGARRVQEAEEAEARAAGREAAAREAMDEAEIVRAAAEKATQAAAEERAAAEKATQAAAESRARAAEERAALEVAAREVTEREIAAREASALEAVRIVEAERTRRLEEERAKATRQVAEMTAVIERERAAREVAERQAVEIIEAAEREKIARKAAERQAIEMAEIAERKRAAREASALEAARIVEAERTRRLEEERAKATRQVAEMTAVIERERAAREVAERQAVEITEAAEREKIAREAAERQAIEMAEVTERERAAREAAALEAVRIVEAERTRRLEEERARAIAIRQVAEMTAAAERERAARVARIQRLEEERARAIRQVAEMTAAAERERAARVAEAERTRRLEKERARAIRQAEADRVAAEVTAKTTAAIVQIRFTD